MPANKSRGFTLIELMVAIAIIAILAAIGLVVYSGVSRAARDSKRVSDINEYKKALEQFHLANNRYLDPVSFGAEGGVISPPSLNNVFNELPSYFASGAVPTDPINSGTYLYRYFTDNTSCSSPKYVMCTVLEDSNQGNTALPLPGTPFNCATFTPGKGAYCVRSSY